MSDRRTLANWPGKTLDDRRRARNEAVCKARSGGQTIAELSRNFDISEPGIKSILQRSGYSAPRCFEARNRRIEGLAQEGLTPAEISRRLNLRYGVVHGVIREWRYRNGIQAPERPRPAEPAQYTRDPSGNVPVSLPYLKFLDPGRRFSWERGHA